MTTGTLLIQTEKKVKIVDTLQVLIPVLAAELDLNFEQQRTADLLTPKMLQASCYWSMSRTSLTESMLQNSRAYLKLESGIESWILSMFLSTSLTEH